MKRLFIILLTLLLTFALCVSCNKQEENNVTEEQPVEEIIIDEPSTTEPKNEDVAESVSIETIIGKWQTEDGQFTYDIQENNVLVTEGPAGSDSDCQWNLEDNTVSFSFSDMASASYKYNSEKDTLESQSGSGWILVRAKE